MNVTGEFETHLSLDARGAVPDWNTLAHAHGMKLTHIVLSHGSEPFQPMLTKQGRGTLEEMLSVAKQRSLELAKAGAQVRRIKIEVDANNPAAPGNTDEVAMRPRNWYFEHHIKVWLPAGSDVACLEQITAPHSARLSRNARLVRPDGSVERFLTQRFYETARNVAVASLHALLADLERAEIAVLETEAEYVVYDSNTAMDSGWLDAPQR